MITDNINHLGLKYLIIQRLSMLCNIVFKFGTCVN